MAEPVGNLNAACPYYTMFPLEFPLGHLPKRGVPARVLDPFCGRGTTLYAARLRGLYVVGVDANPVAAAIAAAKLDATSPSTLVRRARNLITDHHQIDSTPVGDFWQWCYHPETLRDVVSLRAGLLAARNDATVRMLRGITMGVLHGPRRCGDPTYLSNQMPRTYATKPAAAVRFWSKREMRPPRVDVLDLLERRAQHVLRDLPEAGKGRVLCGDARSALRKDEAYTHVITSPPYPGMRTYLPDQWLRAWFIGGPSEPQYHLPGQIGNTSPEPFAAALGSVWRAVARRCAPCAKLVVRFGALPSIKRDPLELLERSIRVAESGWRLVSVEKAPPAAAQRRQAQQFGRNLGGPRTEIDAEFVLDV